AAIDVVLIGGEQQVFPVFCQRNVLDFEIVAGGELLGRTALRRNGIETVPTRFLPRERDAIAVGPDQLILTDDRVIDTTGALIGVPGFATVGRRDVGDANRPRR